jgi:hypothetical protein
VTNVNDWPDRGLRHQVQLEAEVHYPQGHQSKALIANLSLDGCQLQGWFRVGDMLELIIPRVGRVRGQVRWAVAGSAGIRFLPRAGQASEEA